MKHNVALPPGHGTAASVREAFRADRAKYYRIAFGTEAPPLPRRVQLWITNQGFHCVAVHRLGELAWDLKGKRPLAWLAAASLYHALDSAVKVVHHVAVEARVGPGFYIGHPATVYIGRTTIGRNFSVTHNVTIGIGHSSQTAGVPVVGDDVWVGTGSTLFGDIHVGDGATIASGTVLSRSVPPRSLVAGNPGRVIASGYDNHALFGATPEAEVDARPTA